MPSILVPIAIMVAFVVAVVMPVTFVAVVPLPALVIALPAFVIPMVAAVAIAVKVDIRDVDAAVAGNHNDVIAAPLKVVHVHTIQVGNLPPAHRAAMAATSYTDRPERSAMP